MLMLAAFSYLATRRLAMNPGVSQNVMETFMDSIRNLLVETMGEHGKGFFPLVATIGLFIFVSNVLGLIPGFESPTASLNTNLSMALIVYFSDPHHGRQGPRIEISQAVCRPKSLDGAAHDSP
jgi:F-type H+-transporting ATPase subunit a